MNIPYRYRGLGALTLLLVVLPWAAWRFALHDTYDTWRECRRLERRYGTLGPIAPETTPPAAQAPELILSGALLNTVRRIAPHGVRAAGYISAVTLRQDDMEVHTAQITLTGSFVALLRTVEALEKRLHNGRMRSVQWHAAAEHRTRRTQLVLTLYIQQLTITTDTK